MTSLEMAGEIYAMAHRPVNRQHRLDIEAIQKQKVKAIAEYLDAHLWKLQPMPAMYGDLQGCGGVAPASGQLIVGLTEDGRDVVINHPDLDPDKDGVGHIVFSPEQARALAKLLIQKAQDAEGT